MSIRNKLAFWKDPYPTPTFVFRRRGTEASLTYTEAVRMHYDEADNLHELKTDEWTKAAPLDAVNQAKENENRVVVLDDPEGELTQDGEAGTFVGYHYDEKTPEPHLMDDGQTVLFLAEPGDGQLVPAKHNFREKNEETEALADQVKELLPDNKEILVDDDLDQSEKQEAIEEIETKISKIEDKINDLGVSDGFSYDLNSHLIKNKDERLNAYLNHIEIAQEKYVQDDLKQLVRENQELILVVGTGLSVAFMVYAVGQNFAEAIPFMETISNQLPSLENALSNIGGGGSPPGS